MDPNLDNTASENPYTPEPHPLSQAPEDLKRSFATRAEWEAELARRNSVRVADPWSDPAYSGPADSTTVGVPRGAEARQHRYETDAAKMHRLARERNYGAEIERLHQERQKFIEGVTVVDAKTWPRPPRYIEGGVVQKLKHDDDVDPKDVNVYTFEEVVAWRAHAAKLKKLRHGLRCAQCYVVIPKPPLKCMARCSLCKETRYCSAACQKRDWKERHRVHCPARRKAAEARGECEFCRKPKADCVCG